MGFRRDGQREEREEGRSWGWERDFQWRGGLMTSCSIVNDFWNV